MTEDLRTWIPARVAELKVVYESHMERYTSGKATRKEESIDALVMTHLSMHMKDLEKIERELMFVKPTPTEA